MIDQIHSTTFDQRGPPDVVTVCNGFHVILSKDAEVMDVPVETLIKRFQTSKQNDAIKFPAS